MMERLELLRGLDFGSQVAEDEVARLQEYFVQTEQWNRISRGDIDIIRGEKGAGKSALYLLLNKNRDTLFDHNIILVSGENPRGTTVFKDLISDPPATEREFVVLWKLYILVIAAHEAREFGFSDSGMNSVYAALEEAELLEKELNLAGLLRSAHSFVRRLLKSSTEYGLQLDPNTGLPSGIIGKIALGEPSGELRSSGISSLDGMFVKLNHALQGTHPVWTAGTWQFLGVWGH